jgi:hypothetical protein
VLYPFSGDMWFGGAPLAMSGFYASSMRYVLQAIILYNDRTFLIGNRYMALKVVVWGTGNVGRPAIRAVLSHRELELVGVIVASKDKVGHG